MSIQPNLSAARLLIIDEQAESLRAHFKDRFPMIFIATAANALEQIRLHRPKLVLLSTSMPHQDGFDLCRRICQASLGAPFPVVMMHKPPSMSTWGLSLASPPPTQAPTVAPSDTQQITQQALAAGASDCFFAPLNLELIHARCQTYILCTQVVKRHIGTLHLRALNLVMDFVGARDQNTSEHIQRTTAYVRMLGRELSRHPRYADLLTYASIEWLAMAAPMHDIGKLSVPAHVLKKPGALDPQERIVMETHPLAGMLALEIAEKMYAGPIEFFRFAKEIALCHHEKWNGSGYPMGLKGDQIPLSAQIVAVADAYDALRSKRSYKPAQSHEVAVAEITACIGTHFAPLVVEAFLTKASDFATRAATSSLPIAP